MGLMQFLGEVGNDLLYSMLEKGLDASPEKITEYNNDQLKLLIKNGKRITRELASDELRRRK
ncbi:MAG: hypothetical protein ACXAHE_24715 [Roseburia sp. 1XD42-69]|jgi:hypothetical protein